MPAVPKPRKKRKPAKAYSSIARPSHAKAVQAAVALRAKSGPIKKVNRERKVSEFARCYGSKERVIFVNRLPCIIYSCHNRMVENAHIKGDGASRKSDARFIVPLCHWHHTEGPSSLHALQPRLFEVTHQLDLHDRAARTELAWQASLSSRE